MTGDDEQPAPRRNTARAGVKDGERLAAALRENLRRRKVQERARAERSRAAKPKAGSEGA